MVMDSPANLAVKAFESLNLLRHKLVNSLEMGPAYFALP